VRRAYERTHRGHIPANYYDDLAAQFAFPTRRSLHTLADLSLLYDRDERGEFLHFYTETVGDVFLEVLERRDGYDGYGAPNTHVRLTAQYERRRRTQPGGQRR
jgi:4-hydroxyphenylpyruvate dioxygenase